ncbi:MAG: COP23 domain-containing protein [Coleofasciculus sp. B1-GNL1-01]|uniref:COP23 domain-containing protein n=1 Tax=Coleofasciculus sp. B1-GNL1-01 TaxID=3068484 RepID=UPI0032F47E7F
MQQYWNLKKLPIFHRKDIWGTLTHVVVLSLLLIGGATPALSQRTSLNILSEVKGDVRIKRAGRRNYQRAYGGEFLNSSDRLQLGRGATVKVLCSNLFIWNLRAKGEFPVSRGCPVPERPDIIFPKNRRRTRTSSDLTIPYIISPRNTAILNEQPILRWNAVEGATSYQVQVRGSQVNWITEVNQPQVVYSGEQPFQPGSRYWVIVTADNGTSSLEELPAGFTVLGEEEAQEIRAKIDQLQQQPLNDESKAIALAHLYRSYDLNAAAIEVLEGLVSEGNQTTAVYQLLGSIYDQIGLIRLAEEQYEMALEQAKAEDNIEAQGMLQSSLAEVKEALDELPPAFELFQAAQANYRTLGDEEQVQQLQQKLDALEQRLSVAVPEVHRDQDVTFFCGTSEGVPATLARTSQGVVPMILWNSPDINTSGSTAAELCQDVSQKLQTSYQNGEFNYISTRRVDGQTVACLVENEVGGCRESLFALMDGSSHPRNNPRAALQRIMRIRVPLTGPIPEPLPPILINLERYLNSEYPSLTPIRRRIPMPQSESFER